MIARDLMTSRNVAASAQVIKRRMRQASGFLPDTLPIVRLRPLPGFACAAAVVPRLAGFVRTGPLGQIRIRTILPGSYGGPPHLHFEFRDSLGAMRMSYLNLFPPLAGDYSAYGPDFTRKFRRSRPGLNRFSFSAPQGPLTIVQPADLDITPDSAGVFRVAWGLVLDHPAPIPNHPGWGPEAPH
jgi:hypothetical protein